MGPEVQVVNPLGEPVVQSLGARPGLATLNGKTVSEVWNGGFQGQVSFPIIREMLKARYPGVKIVPYTEFPLFPVPSLAAEVQAENLESLRKVLLETGCDALITGNGG